MNTQREIIELNPAPAPMPTGNALTPMDMLNKALASGANMDVLEKLMALQERYEATLARKAFDAAMADAKAQIGTVKKDAKGNYGQYADFANVTRTVDPALAAHGFRYRHRLDQQTDKSMTVTCIVYHRDGHCEETTLTAPLDTSGSKNAIQQIGSTQTYLQRYTLMAALGLAAEKDDDGTTAAPSGSSETLSDEQIKKLRDALAFKGLNEARFLKSIKVERIEDVFADAFADCLKLINGSGK